METTKRAYKSRIKTNKRTGKPNKKVNLLKKRIAIHHCVLDDQYCGG